MSLRFLLAALSLHCAVCAIVLLCAGGVDASLFLVGFGYLWFLQGLGHVPILIIPAAIAFVCFVLLLVYSVERPRVFLLFVGLFPIVVFLGVSEVFTFGAMRISVLGLGQDACMFDRQTFTASLLDFVKNADFLFGDTLRYQHHALVVLPNENLMMWSYGELSFVDYQTSYSGQQQVPQECMPA